LFGRRPRIRAILQQPRRTQDETSFYRFLLSLLSGSRRRRCRRESVVAAGTASAVGQSRDDNNDDIKNQRLPTAKFAPSALLGVQRRSQGQAAVLPTVPEREQS